MRPANRLFFAAGLALSLGLAACGPKGGAVTSEDMSLGNPKADVTVIEYASASCVHCAAWDKDVWPAFKAKYVDTNQVNYVFREFITSPPQLAAAGFLLARCAGKDKYFGVLDQVFRAQDEVFRTGDMRGPLVAVAAQAGLSEDQFNKCVGDEKALNELNARVEKYSRDEQINSTPTFVVNGTKLEGEQTMAAMDAAIAAARAKK
ncbi:MAG: thioredoxin domain-containing protein [Alphaproteobacteria bacterium]